MQNEKNEILNHVEKQRKEIEEFIISRGLLNKQFPGLYDFNDSFLLNSLSTGGGVETQLFALDRLLERDKLREKDGFPRKIKLGRLIRPVRGGNNKTVVVPTTTEEKFYHWQAQPNEGGEGETGGTGEGEEGEVIGEAPLRPGEGEGDGAGQGSEGEHGQGADAYEIGRILTEQFELPNIQEKGKKRSLTNYTYDLTDKNLGHGQILDKKSTLKRIVKTNLALGNINSTDSIDPSKLILSPKDLVYKILSKERDYESQAMVFFLRDYSGSMQGKPTEVVVTQHVYLHSWLLYQYKKQVVSRFIVHDTDAIEVPDFYTYYNKNVAGGTQVASAFQLVNKIVAEENLAKDYNIYVFHGTDGDDWDEKGDKVIPEIEKMLKYVNRIGITVAAGYYSKQGNTAVEKYIKSSKLLEKFPSKLRLNSMVAADANEDKIIKGIKELISA